MKKKKRQEKKQAEKERLAEEQAQALANQINEVNLLCSCNYDRTIYYFFSTSNACCEQEKV